MEVPACVRGEYAKEKVLLVLEDSKQKRKCLLMFVLKQC